MNRYSPRIHQAKAVKQPHVDPQERTNALEFMALVKKLRADMVPFLKHFAGMSDVDLANPVNVRSHLVSLNTLSSAGFLPEKTSAEGHDKSDLHSDTVALLETFFDTMMVLSYRYVEEKSEGYLKNPMMFLITNNSNFLLGCCWIYILLKVGYAFTIPKETFLVDRQVISRIAQIIVFLEGSAGKYKEAMVDVGSLSDMPESSENTTRMDQKMIYCFTGDETAFSAPEPKIPVKLRTVGSSYGFAHHPYE